MKPMTLAYNDCRVDCKASKTAKKTGTDLT